MATKPKPTAKKAPKNAVKATAKADGSTDVGPRQGRSSKATRNAGKSNGTGAEPTAKPGRVPRTKLLDQSACAVIRWMQSQGWDFAKCRKALDALGATAISDQTIRCQLTGKRGDAATLTKEQAKKLNDAAK